MAKAEANNWPLLAYPKKLKLPTDLYQAQVSTSEANANQKKSFLTETQRDLVRAKFQKTLRTSRTPRIPQDGQDPITPRKRASNLSMKKRKKVEYDPENPGANERRSSARKKNKVIYTDAASDDDSDGSPSSQSDSDSLSDS